MRIKTSFLIILMLSLGFLTSCLPEDDVIVENQQIVTPVITALEEYKEMYGMFPENLNELIPQFVDEIPKTRTGKDYFYSTNSVDGYILGFIVRRGFGCGYTFGMKKWECGYGD